jgi:anti-sigma B factor antagonist
MTIQERVVASVPVLDLDGRLCLGDGDVLLKETVRRLMRDGHLRVVLNLTNVTYADSSGLGSLMGTFLEARKNGVTLRLHSPSRRLHDLLVMTRLRDVLEISESESHALASFAGS